MQNKPKTELRQISVKYSNLQEVEVSASTLTPHNTPYPSYVEAECPHP